MTDSGNELTLITCPGCRRFVHLDPMNGWRNDQGYTCYPANTTHSDHVLPYLESRHG